MIQIMRRVATRQLAGVCLVVATLTYLASCQTNAGVEPTDPTRRDSTSTRTLGGEDGEPLPPKKPNGPGCCQ